MNLCKGSTLLKYLILNIVVVTFATSESSQSVKNQLPHPLFQEESVKTDDNDLSSSLDISSDEVDRELDFKINDNTTFTITNFENFIVESNFNTYRKTSCGEILCFKVKDYPEDKIRRLAFERAEKDCYDSEKPYSKDELDLRMKIHYCLQVVSSEVASRTLKTLIKKKKSKQITYNEKCFDMGSYLYPKEAYNMNLEPILIVNVDDAYKQPAKLCTAPEHCEDSSTPVGHEQFCETKIRPKEFRIYNAAKDVLEQQKILVPDGCYCRLVRKNV